MRPQMTQLRWCKVTLATFVWFVFNDRHSYWICWIVYRHIMIPNILFHYYPVNDVVLCWTVVSIWDQYNVLISDWEEKKWKFFNTKYAGLILGYMLVCFGRFIIKRAGIKINQQWTFYQCNAMQWSIQGSVVSLKINVQVCILPSLKMP